MDRAGRDLEISAGRCSSSDRERSTGSEKVRA